MYDFEASSLLELLSKVDRAYRLHRDEVSHERRPPPPPQKKKKTAHKQDICRSSPALKRS